MMLRHAKPHGWVLPKHKGEGARSGQEDPGGAFLSKNSEGPDWRDLEKSGRLRLFPTRSAPSHRRFGGPRFQAPKDADRNFHKLIKGLGRGLRNSWF